MLAFIRRNTPDQPIIAFPRGETLKNRKVRIVVILVTLQGRYEFISKKSKSKNNNVVVVYKAPQKKKAPKKKQRKQSRSNIPRVMMSPCAAKYAAAIASPFSPDAFGACIPMGGFRATQKVHARVMATVTVGSGGIGFLAISPCLANDGIAIYTTGGTYTGTAGVGLNVSATGVTGVAMPQLPYTKSQLLATDVAGVRNSVQGRIVSVGVRYRYTGTELNRGGSVAAYVDPLHMTVESVNFNSVAALTGTIVTAPDANHTASGFGMGAVLWNELLFPDTSIDSTGTLDQLLCYYPWSGGVGTNLSAVDGAPIASIFFNGLANNTYLVEVIVHAEYQGTSVNAVMTENTPDEIGATRIQGACARASNLNTQAPNAPWSEKFWTAYEDMMRELQPVAVRGLRSVAMGYIKGALNRYGRRRTGGYIMNGEL